MRRSIVLSLLCLPTLVLAQQATHTISPGMTRAQVEAALGAPATLRTASEFTYMFYPNTCGRECGMNDLVILRHDSVTDAIFRSPTRHYTGTSSSPAEARPQVAPRRSRATTPKTTHADSTKKAATTPMKTHADSTKKAATTPAKASDAPAKSTGTTQMKPPSKANDAKPSIPVKTTPMPTAPAKAPAKAPAPDKKPG